MLPIKTPDDVAQELAERFRQCRLQRGLSRAELARRAGEKMESIKRFELKGEIALKRLLKLALVLDALDTFKDVLIPKAPMTMDELKNKTKVRQRGRRSNK